MLTTATAILSLTPLLAVGPTDAAVRFPTLPFVWEQQRSIERQPDVRLWFRGDNLFRHGDGADVYFQTDDDAYVMIVRIDTDGRLQILSPSHRDDYQLARGGRTYHVPGYTRGSFRVDDDPGMGYVFAVASWEPFDFDRVHWSYYGGTYRYASRRVHGDPFIAVQDLADDMLGSRGYYAMDHVAYYVNRRYEYPRYLCYDCHGYRTYAHWDPYAYRCASFRIVIYNDRYYYPYRYSRGSRVIYVRDPRRPRYEFKDVARTASRNEPYIDYRFRGDDLDRRRPGSPSNDPNLPRRASSTNPGATRPGDDVPSNGSRVGGRRVIGSDTPASPGPDGRLPRRQDEVDRAPDNREPRREPAGGIERPSGGDARERESAGPRREPERTGGSRSDVPTGGTRTPRREEVSSPRSESRDAEMERIRREPRRDEVGVGSSESGRTGAPRREVERTSEPSREAAPSRAPERRSEPRREDAPSREVERRSEPRREAAADRAPERRSEPRRETSSSRQPERRVEAKPSQQERPSSRRKP